MMKKKAEKKPSTHITGWDVLAMTRAENEASVAQQCLAHLQTEQRLVQARHEAAALASQIALDALKTRVKEQQERLNRARQDAQTLATEVADKHSISWSTYSYHPETGELIAAEH